MHDADLWYGHAASGMMPTTESLQSDQSALQAPNYANTRSLKDEGSGEKDFTEKVEANISDLGSGDTIHNERELQRLTRKIDRRVLPISMALYCCSFLDRVNIGNARLMGLEEDLNLYGDRYQIAVSVFFITYCLTEVPSNLVLKKFKPQRYLPFIAIAWGIVATCTGAVQTFGGLVAIRLVMGVFESGLLPGLVVFFTTFYTRKQIAQRIACLIICIPISGSIGGLLATAISHMDGRAGIASWRWLMILEGLPTIVLGLIAPFLLPESMEKAKFLTDAERAILLARRRAEFGQTEHAQKFDFRDVVAGIKDWQIWVFCCKSFMVSIILYGFSTFLPTIIKATGSWSSAEANALTVPVYFLGACVYALAAYTSDRVQQRGLVVAAFMTFIVIGYSMLIAHKGAAVSYAGTFIVACGIYTALGIPLAWLPANKPRWAKRAFATAISGACGNVAGAVMPFIFRTKDGPRYTTGYAVSIAMIVGAAIISSSMSRYYVWENRRRDRGELDWKLVGKTEEEIEMLGDYSPRYRYTP